jgi:hypothetical protein
LIHPLWTRVKPDDGSLSLFDVFYHPGTIRQNRDVDVVAERRYVAHGASLFKFAAQLTNDKALPGLHGEETGLGFYDQTLSLSFVRQMFTYCGTIPTGPGGVGV